MSDVRQADICILFNRTPASFLQIIQELLDSQLTVTCYQVFESYVYINYDIITHCLPLLQQSLEACEDVIKKYEQFLDQMSTNDEKINSVMGFANRLCDENHYAADKVNKKAENLDER